MVKTSGGGVASRVAGTEVSSAAFAFWKRRKRHKRRSWKIIGFPSGVEKARNLKIK
ncbi:MAG: hypothetical protein WCG61_02780 [Chlorobium sp.]